MKAAVLSVQGAFAEHEKMLKKIGVDCVELRQRSDLSKQYDGLVLPGGESTVQGKLLQELDMLAVLKKQIEDGMPVLATCAGLILLAERLSNDSREYFQTLPVTVQRNAYGRQLGSFSVRQEIEGIGEFPMEFIRAPYVESAGGEVKVLAKVEERIVAVRYKNQIGLAFHPELSDDVRIHQVFKNMM